MKKQLHPSDYRPVVFQDATTGFAFLTQSTASTNDTIDWEDGQSYPLIKVHISSSSHPFFTGEQKLLDTTGRVDRFKAHAKTAAERKQMLAQKAKKSILKAEQKAAKAKEK